MCLKERLLKALKSKQGNALLLATAGAIAATFSVYFFVSITNLSESSKQRVAHLYNAYQMGESIKARIDGADKNATRLTVKTKKEIENEILEVFHHEKFITLRDMVHNGIIVVGDDPTASQRKSADTPYDLDNSGALIKYVDDAGAAITDDTAVVNDINLFVNLAGTADSENNLPYGVGEPFYYILMSSTNATGTGLSDTDHTIDLSLYTAGILSDNQGGPQAEVSVILPQDNP